MKEAPTLRHSHHAVCMRVRVCVCVLASMQSTIVCMPVMYRLMCIVCSMCGMCAVYVCIYVCVCVCVLFVCCSCVCACMWGGICALYTTHDPTPPPHHRNLPPLLSSNLLHYKLTHVPIPLNGNPITQ